MWDTLLEGLEVSIQANICLLLCFADLHYQEGLYPPDYRDYLDPP